WLTDAGVRIQLGGKPAVEAPCFVVPLGEDASHAAVRLGLEPPRQVAVDMFGRFTGRRTLMKTPLTKAEIIGAAAAALSAGKVPVTVIKDSPGFVGERRVGVLV